MEESTPIYDALWEKYNSTPIFDQLEREYEERIYVKLVEPYKYPLNDQRVFSPEEFVEMMTSNEILSMNEIRALFRIPPTNADYEQLMFGNHPEVRTVPTMSYEDWQESFLNPPAQQQEKKLMNSWQELVNDFREAMDLPTPEWPRQLTGEEAEMHIQMIRDEFEKEFVPAARDNDLVAFYDAGIDMIVYLIGAMSNAGMDIDPGFVEVMRSNMTKMDPDTGKAIRSRGEAIDGEPTGKVLKGPAYEEPKLGVILNEMARFGFEDKRVYKNLTIPLTLGIGGPKIGEGTINMDHNGEVMFKGVMMDVSILPILDHLGLSVAGVSMGPDEGEGDQEDADEVVSFVDARLTKPAYPVEIREEDIHTFDPPILFNEEPPTTEPVQSRVDVIMADKDQYLKPVQGSDFVAPYDR